MIGRLAAELRRDLRSPDRARALRGILIVATAIVLMEAIVLLPSASRVPALALYLLIVFVAARHGMLAGAACALFGVAYTLTDSVLLGRSRLPGNDTWRLVVVVAGVPTAAVIIGSMRDRFDLLLARERAARAEAEAQREWTQNILESISDSFLIVDEEWRIVYLNQAAERLLRRERSQLRGQPAADYLSQVLDGFFQKYNEAQARGGAIEFDTASMLNDGWYKVHAYPSEEGVTIHFRNITEHRASEQQLRRISMADELTGLYNRRGFLTLAQQQLRQANRKRRSFVVMFIDLDGLKRINDTFGHGTGDRALATVAAAMRESFRESDILARIGGDEFAALALETDADSTPILLDRLHQSLAAHADHAGLLVPVTVSVGTSTFDPDAPLALDELIAAADQRMYSQKRARAEAGARGNSAAGELS